MPHHTTVRTALNLGNDQQLGVAASMLDFPVAVSVQRVVRCYLLWSGC